MSVASPNVKLVEEKQDNSGERLYNVWEKKSSHKKSLNLDSEHLIQIILNKMKSATDVVCLSSNAPLPKEVLQEIPLMAQKGIRVYLLLSEYDSMYDSFITNKAIVRVEKEVVGNMLLIDPKLITRNGYLFSFNSFDYTEGSTNFYVPFDSVQLKEAYHYFLNLFWLSKEEYRESKISSNIQQLQPPFDIFPLIDPDSFYYNNKDLSYLNSKIENIIRRSNKCIYLGLSKINDFDLLYSTIVGKAKQGISITIYTGLELDHSFIKELCSIENICVKAFKNLNNFFVLADNEVGLLLSGSVDGVHEVGISLSSKSVQDFIYRLDLLESDVWLFHKEISLGDIQSELVYVDEFKQQLKETKIEQQNIIDYGEVIAPTLREFYEGTFKPTKKNKDNMVKTIIHRWKLIPPLLDSNAKLDSLYDQWKKEEHRLRDYLQKVLEYAKTVNNEKKTAFSSLFGSLFRKEDKVKVNVEEIISNLESAILDIEKEKFNWSNIDELLKQIQDYTSTLIEQQLELKEKQTYYEEKQKWERQRDSLLSKRQEKLNELDDINLKKQEVQEKVNELAPEAEEINLYKDEILSLEKKIASIIENESAVINSKKVNDIIAAICEDLDQRIQSYNKIKKTEKKKYFTNKVLPYLKGQFELIGKESILNSIMVSNNIKDAKEKMVSIKKEIALHGNLKEEIPTEKFEILKHYESLCGEKDELELTISNLEKNAEEYKSNEKKELENLEKNILRVQKDLNQIEKDLNTLGAEFSYSSNQIKGEKLPFNQNYKLNLPKESLPLVGKLYKIGQKRQLAISSKEDFNLGVKESDRLQAQLVLSV